MRLTNFLQALISLYVIKLSSFFTSDAKNITDNYKIGLMDYEILNKYFSGKSLSAIINTVSAEELSSHLDDSLNIHISIFFLKPTQNLTLTDLIFEEIDRFLAPRLWWSLKRYVIDENSNVEWIIFQRASISLEKSLRVLTSLNFPPTQDICKSRPLNVYNMNGGSWGNGAKNAMSGINFKSVNYIHAPSTGSFQNDVFATKSECPERHQLNLHECLFLPSTNCSIDVRNITLNMDRHIHFYRFADNDTIPVLDSQRRIEFEKPYYKNLPTFNLPPDIIEKETLLYSIKPEYSYLKIGTAPNIILNDSVVSELYTDGFTQTKMLNGYIHRPNAEFRLKIQRYIDYFRDSFSPPFSSDLPCVMLHMRKTDRHIKDEDMISWCQHHTYYDDVTQQWKGYGNLPDGKPYFGGKVSHTNIANFGCMGTLPFGAMSLEHYLNASLIIAPDIKNILVATDDVEWYQKALQDYDITSNENNLIKRHNLKMFLYQPYAGVGHHRDHSIESNAEFFATKELGQQCSGFVGTMRSAATQFILNTVCYYNYFEYLRCPTIFSL